MIPHVLAAILALAPRTDKSEALQIATQIVGYCAAYDNVPVSIAVAVAFHESTFRPYVKGPFIAKAKTRACGVMGIRLGGSADDVGASLFDIATNVRLGVAHLSRLHRRFPRGNGWLSVYDGHKHPRVTAYSTAVVETARHVERLIAESAARGTS